MEREGTSNVTIEFEGGVMGLSHGHLGRPRQPAELLLPRALHRGDDRGGH